jgi:copper(I)-binding protein
MPSLAESDAVIPCSDVERRIDFSEITHWLQGVKRLQNLLSGEVIPYHKEMELKLGGMQVGIFELKKSI